MSIVYFYMTVSLDGFIAGPDNDVGRLFSWYFSGDTRVPIPGSPTLRVSSASAELIDEYGRTAGADEVHIALAPVLLGSGVHLYESLGPEAVDLEIMRVVHTPEVTHLRYRVVRRGP
jgi:hypothetical protein